MRHGAPARNSKQDLDLFGRKIFPLEKFRVEVCMISAQVVAARC